ESQETLIKLGSGKPYRAFKVRILRFHGSVPPQTRFAACDFSPPPTVGCSVRFAVDVTPVSMPSARRLGTPADDVIMGERAQPFSSASWGAPSSNGWRHRPSRYQVPSRIADVGNRSPWCR